jgi:hypothetical protein
VGEDVRQEGLLVGRHAEEPASAAVCLEPMAGLAHGGVSVRIGRGYVPRANCGCFKASGERCKRIPEER